MANVKNNTLKTLKYWIIGMSIFQLLMYISAAWIVILSNNGVTSDLDVMAALLPMSLYILVGPINLILVIIYAIKLNASKQKFDWLIASIVILLLSITIFAPQITQYVESIKLG